MREIIREDTSPRVPSSDSDGPLVVRPRLEAIDELRGLVMVVMALDHVRVFLYAQVDPLNLSPPNTTLFLTRWVTHFCAPVFVFLAGTSIFLYGSTGKTKWQQSWFLLTRGLWLVLLELTFVRLGWSFTLDYEYFVAQVIWAIGWSMVLMAGLVFLPWPVVTSIGITLVAGHNALHELKASDFGEWRWLWVVLETPDELEMSNKTKLFIAYPLLSWLGVMAAGYGFGAVWLLDRDQRRRWLLGLGVVLTLLYVILRWDNRYGDPWPWQHQSTDWSTFLSFINCWKYPPSLLFVLMTLGPAMFALAWFDRRPAGALSKPLVVFGRVPMFFYLLHAPLIHVITIMIGYFDGWRDNIKVLLHHPTTYPKTWGYDLWVVYLVWIIVVVMLYPVCRRYADFKRRRTDWWLSYL